MITMLAQAFGVTCSPTGAGFQQITCSDGGTATPNCLNGETAAEICFTAGSAAGLGCAGGGQA
jgi:hypothetical protein